jgi:hypothetical protein
MNAIIPLEREAIQYFRAQFALFPPPVQKVIREQTEKHYFDEKEVRAIIEILEILGENKSAELFAQIMQRWNYDAEPWEKMAVVGFLAANSIKIC